MARYNFQFVLNPQGFVCMYILKQTQVWNYDRNWAVYANNCIPKICLPPCVHIHPRIGYPIHMACWIGWVAKYKETFNDKRRSMWHIIKPGELLLSGDAHQDSIVCRSYAGSGLPCHNADYDIWIGANIAFLKSPIIGLECPLTRVLPI
jgi:hypothetical protein